jgi:7-carboxy-7-deazaguanine synthase
MFGDNPVRRQELGDGDRLWIQEVFYTLQGEGPFTGEPAVFVRLAGCNLRCTWCDTDFESSTWQPSRDELLGTIEESRTAVCDLVVLTGGEPLRQNISPLVEELLGRGLRVQIETSGSLWLDLPEHERLFILCSPKTGKLHPGLVDRVTAYKYVIAAGDVDPEDGLPVLSTQVRGAPCRIARPTGRARVYVMPRDDQDPERNAANVQTCLQVAMKFGYTLTLQTHKLLNIR